MQGATFSQLFKYAVAAKGYNVRHFYIALSHSQASFCQ